MTHEELLLFGERLRNRRDVLGVTQEFVSTEAGISLRFYQMIERGEKGVSLDTLIQLSKSLTISIDYLLFGDAAYTFENPLTEILNGLSPQQKEDALRVLRLFSKASNHKNQHYTMSV